MKSKLGLSVLALLFVSNLALSFDEGIEYKRVSPAQPTITKNKIEVIELFWYGCPHCFNFEPNLNAWIKNKPDNVVFIRIPAVFNPNWALHARAYYTAETLGLLKTDKNTEGKPGFHETMFDEIHKKKKRLNNKRDLQTIFARFGVSMDDFNNTFESFSVNTKVDRAMIMSKRYQLTGVPTLIVNGKYRTDGPMAGDQKGMLKVLDSLIRKESIK